MDRELQHIRTALQHCQFPDWALNQWQHKFTNPNQPTTTTTTNNNNNPPANNKKNITIVVPYMPNTGEKFRKLCKKRHTSTLQRHQHIKDSTRKPQGQGPPKQPNRNHISLPMPPNKLFQCIYRGVRQIIGWKSQWTFQGPFPPSTFTAPPQDTQWIQNNSV